MARSFAEPKNRLRTESRAELLFADSGMELGRSGRSMLISAGAGGQAQPATGSSTKDRKICSTDSGGRFSVNRFSLPSRACARGWGADDGTGGAVRATGWRATAIPFQQLW